MPTPHKCPICNGKGRVFYGFYNIGNINTVSSPSLTEVCRSCNGTGIVYDQ